MSRKGFEIREELKNFWADDKALSAEAFGRIARQILQEAFESIKTSVNTDKITEKALEEFSILLGAYTAGQKKILWQEFKRLYDARVIKQAALIDYIMKEKDFSREEALKYVAETFGMKGSTQSVYKSDEFIIRQLEKTQNRNKNKHL